MAAQRTLSARLGVRIDEVEDRPAKQAAVTVPQQVSHALVDVGNDAAIIRHPDTLLGYIHQLLESLFALLECPGPFLQPGLPALECRGVTQGRTHQAAQQPERFSVAIGKGVGLEGDHFQHPEGSLLVTEGHDQNGADAQLTVGLLG
jgi:hypothetical protein